MPLMMCCWCQDYRIVEKREQAGKIYTRMRKHEKSCLDNPDNEKKTEGGAEQEFDK